MNRPQLLRRTLTRLFESTSGIDIEAVVVIDECMESLELCVGFAKEHRLVIDYSPIRRGAIHCWNLGLKEAHADRYFHQGDDLDYEDGWLDKLLEAHQTKLQGFGLVGTNDGMLNGNTTIATHFLFDKKFCVECMGGVMAPPVYFYYCVDNEANGRARNAGRFYWCEDSLTRHLHPAKGYRPIDDTDRWHGDDAWNHDIPLFEQRQSQRFPNNFEPSIS